MDPRRTSLSPPPIKLDPDEYRLEALVEILSNEVVAREELRLLTEAVGKVLGPALHTWLEYHGPACTQGNEESFIIGSLNHIHLHWPTKIHGPLPLRAIICLWRLGLRGYLVSREHLGLSIDNLLFSCTLCKEGIGSLWCVLEHLGDRHLTDEDEAGMVDWEKLPWLGALPIEGVNLERKAKFAAAVTDAASDVDESELKRKRKSETPDQQEFWQDRATKRERIDDSQFEQNASFDNNGQDEQSAILDDNHKIELEEPEPCTEMYIEINGSEFVTWGPVEDPEDMSGLSPEDRAFIEGGNALHNFNMGMDGVSEFLGVDVYYRFAAISDEQ